MDAHLESDVVLTNLAHCGDQAYVAVAYMGDRLGGVEGANVAVLHLEVPSALIHRSDW